jgi:hypothetical protein
MRRNQKGRGWRPQQVEIPRIRRHRRTAGNDINDEFQTAQQVVRAIWLAETGVAVGRGQREIRGVAGGIKDAEPSKLAQLGGDLGA